MIIAIDGPAGAGKSTTAHALAGRLGFAYIDTGAMYRAMALAALEKNIDCAGADCEDAEKIGALARSLPLRFEDNGRRVFIGEREVTDEIRAASVGAAASQIAALPQVREAAVAHQRQLAREGERISGGAVLEGRDIQTVVFPDAQVKIFLDAASQTRAARRLEQWRETSEQATSSEAEQDIDERDERDKARIVSPLCAAPDATVLATDELSSEQVLERIIEIVESKRNA